MTLGASVRGFLLAILAFASAVAFPAPSLDADPLRQSALAPRLLVLLVVDQFRADYVDLYGSQWTGGLHELVAHGAVFTDARVPYGVTKTCTGHSTIGTGTFPSTHGIIDNDWFDRGSRTFVGCTADAGVDAVAFGGANASEHHSAKWMRAPTLADELRRQAPTPPIIVVAALKARSAVTLAGQGGPGTLVIWEEDTGAWATSTAFAKNPPQEVSTYLTAHPAWSARGQMWNRLLLPSAYRFSDRAPGEAGGSVFPHALNAPLDALFAGVWDSSPWSDTYLGDIAGSLAEHRGIGQHAGTDMLVISFAALDYVGHSFGPRSHEVQDVLARLDGTIGALIERLDRTVGREHYVIALSSDHGVAMLPEQSMTGTASSGRLNLGAVARSVERALVLSLGARPYVEAVSTNALYFRPGVLELLRSNPAATALVNEAARRVPGVDRVYWGDDLAASTPTTDATLIAMRRSYFQERSGDLSIVPARDWVLADTGTNHGSPYDYDTRVPLIFLGSGIVPGRYTVPAFLVDIAPTMARIAGITMPRTDGRVLREMIQP